MKKNIAKLSMLLVLVCLLLSCFSVSALAAGSDAGSEEGILGVVGDVYGTLEETFEPIFTYFRLAIPELMEITEPVIKYAIVGAVLLAVVVVVVLLVISIFKGRFGRALARTILWCTVLWGVSFLQLLVRQIVEALGDGIKIDFESVCGAFHLDMALLMSDLYELVSKVPILVDEKLYWLLPLVFLAALVLIIVVCALIISASKKKARRKAAAARAAAAAEAEAALAEAPETPVLEAPVESEAPVEAPAAEAPAAETPDAEAPVAEAPVEETPAPESESALDEYPVLDTPVFMPIPTAIFDTVDFTDPKRDGFALATGVAGLDASYGMSDELAEELTAVVYAGAQGGEIVKIGVDCLCANFKPYSYVNVKILRRLGLVPESASAIMVVDHGTVDKPLMVEAADFSPVAVKMLTLAGGRAVRLA